MLTIDINEIIEYSKCPMCHFFKYKHKISSDKVNVIEKYNNDLLKVIYYSYIKIQEGEFIRVEDLKQMWGRLWIKDKRKSNIVFSDSYANKDEYNIKRVKGLESLLRFREVLSSEKCYPVIINQDYSVNLDNGITLVGKFDIVREVEHQDGSKEIQTCVFKADYDNHKLTNLYDFKFHAESMAIEGLVHDINLSHSIYYMDKGKYVTKRNKGLTRDIFLHNVKTIANLINNEIYYMSINENCQRCIYKDMCSSSHNTRALLDKGA